MGTYKSTELVLLRSRGPLEFRGVVIIYLRTAETFGKASKLGEVAYQHARIFEIDSQGLEVSHGSVYADSIFLVRLCIWKGRN